MESGTGSLIFLTQLVKVVVCACYGVYFVAHVFKYLAPNFCFRENA